MRSNPPTGIDHRTILDRWARSALILLALAISLPPGPAAAQTNLGLAAQSIAASQQWIVFTVRERGQFGTPGGCDLNGDSDCFDLVPYVYDTVGGTTTHLDLAVTSFKVAGHFAAFAVSERKTGHTDLNGDGDTRDTVLYVYDLSTAAGGTGIATNTGWALRAYEMNSQYVVFSTSESQQRTDLNGDGDKRDWVVQVWDLNGNALWADTGLQADYFAFAGDWIALRVSEARQGRTDLNGDGDTRDRVLELYQISTKTTVNVGTAVYALEVSPTACIFTVPESSQGNTDLNGDGDTRDRVVEVYVYATAQLYPIDVAATSTLAVGQTYAAFTADEWAAGPGGTDLNGDGDVNDDVVQVVDLATGAVTNLASDGDDVNLIDVDGNATDDFAVFVDSEAADGGTDYNLDGDANDLVIRAYDLSLGTFDDIASAKMERVRRNNAIGRRSFRHAFYQWSGNYLVFRTQEASEGATDLNGDGDALDTVAQVYDLATQTLVSTGLDAEYYEVAGNLIGIATRESAQGNVDQNGDGDTADITLNIYDMSLGLPGTVTPIPVAVPPYTVFRQSFAVGASFIAYRDGESADGLTDLNGDGDTRDFVIGYGVP